MKAIFSFVVKLILLLVLCYVSYVFIKTFLNSFKTGTDTEKTLLSGFMTFIITTIVTAWYKHRDNKNAILNDLRKMKSDVYFEFVDFYINKMLGALNKGEKIDIDREMQAFLFKYTPKISLWGSDRVLKKYLELKDNKLVEAHESNPYEILDRFENLVLEMRADLGYGNSRIEKRDLIRLFVNDVPKQ